MQKLGEDLKINLNDAPLIAAYCFIDSRTQVKISWPAKMRLAELSARTRKENGIITELSWIGRQYQALYANKKTKSVAPHIFPFLGKINAIVYGPKQSLSEAALRLSQQPLPYCQKLARSLNDQLGQKDRNSNSKAINLPGPVVTNRRTVELVKCEPLNEIDSVISTLYAESGLPWSVLAAAWGELPYQQKEKLFNKALKKDALDLSYLVELVTEPFVIIQLQTRFNNLSLQDPTTVHGYELPKAIEDGGMMERSFDKSYELFAKLQAEMPAIAPLACLFGHRQRYLIQTNYIQLVSSARELTNKSSASLLSKIYNELALKHPLTGAELQRVMADI